MKPDLFFTVSYFVHCSGCNNEIELYMAFKNSKACAKWPFSKRPNIGFHDQLLLNVCRKYCRM